MLVRSLAMVAMLAGVAYANSPPRTFCETNPRRCHWITKAERARFEALGAALRKTVPRIHTYVLAEHTQDRFFEQGIGEPGATWWDFSIHVSQEPRNAPKSYVTEYGVSVSLTPLPAAATYYPSGIVQKHGDDHVTIEYPTFSDDRHLRWIIVGEIAGEGAPFVPESAAQSPSSDVRSVLIGIVGQPADVDRVASSFDIAAIRKIIATY